MTKPDETRANTAGTTPTRRQPRIPSIRPRSLGAMRFLQADLDRRPAGRRPRWWSPFRLGTDLR